MSRFTSPLVIEEVRPGRVWRLRAPIVYEVGAKGSGITIVVPVGTETDGATIPAALRLLLAVWGTYGRAAAMHDYLYSILRSGNLRDETLARAAHPAFAGWDSPRMRLDMDYWLDRSSARRWADAEFYSAMLACGTSRPLAWTIWAMVRLFGGAFARGGAP